MGTPEGDPEHAGASTAAGDPAARATAQPISVTSAYVNQRLIAEDVSAFRNDHSQFTDGPGFHIYGPCPSCGHQTSSVCATDFLAQDLAASPTDTADRQSQGVPEGWTDPLEGQIKERRQLRPQLPPPREQTSGTQLGAVVGWLSRNLPDGSKPAENADVSGTATKTMITVMRCACTSNHVAPSGTGSPPPPGTFGCGAEWVLRVEYDGSANAALLHPVGNMEAALCWPAADAAAAEVPNALTTAQALAKNWAAGLTAVLTLLGVGALLSDTSTVRGLDTGWQILFGITALVAVLADGFMIYTTTVASYGSFRNGDALRPSDLRNADLDPLLQARASERQLRKAMRSTVIAVIAALAATAILLYGHSASTSSAATVAPVAVSHE